MNGKLKRFVMVVASTIALALCAQAGATEEGSAIECPGEPVDACAMGQWGIAIAIMGDLRSPLDAAQLARGAAAIARAKAIGGKSERECELIDAVAQFYHRHEERTHDMRLVYYERALSRSRRLHPDDLDIELLHAHASRVAFARALERVEAAHTRRAQAAP